ncbi:hypothetical protein FHS26_005555 [Rhizobium pisi]|nr:hypothetical protein [Rhizobium pisi]MBB3137787.1 hypothetical protein [Rhizobium pisi]TCA47690.1 hypothetical protein E0J16_27400 [Rhizobium pisi]
MGDQDPKAGNRGGHDGFNSLVEAVFEGAWEIDGEFALLVTGALLLILAIIFISRALCRLAGWGWRFFRALAGDKVNAGPAKARLKITP